MLLAEGSENTIGVVAICKNEERDLPGFFSNFLPWVDEIVIVDDISQDNSKEIIESTPGNIKIVNQAMDEKLGFSGQRNIGIKNSTCDWILHTDIDERVTQDFVDEVLGIVSRRDINGCKYRRKNFFLHRAMRGGGLQDWNKPQLARRGKHHFVNPIHEECIVEGYPHSVIQLRNRIWHLCDASYIERIHKSAAYSVGQADRLEQRGISIKWWHLLLLPAGEFIRKYILKAGFIDGTPGLIWALNSTCSMFRSSAILWDRRNSISRDLLEKKLDTSDFANRRQA